LNDKYPETFGIVHAECNAVGTPFLSYPLGATRELADHNQEIVNDMKSNKDVIERLILWKKTARPKVRCLNAVRMDRVLGQWLELLAIKD
jgi:hypothetical protein